VGEERVVSHEADATPGRAVGTCPIIFVAIRFISAPLMPVISAGGIRVVLVMSPPLPVVLNMETPDARRM
jgi:hypothetical protein